MSGEPAAESEGPGADDGGDEGSSETGVDEQPEAEPLEMGPTPMRRLTSDQYVFSVRDLLDVPDWLPEGDLPNDGFNEEEFQLSNMLAAGVATTIVDYGRYRELAKSAAEAAFPTDAAMTQRLGCMPSDVADACVEAWLRELCRRAWSRPVMASDPVLGALRSAAEDGQARLGTVRDGLVWAVSTLLQTPEFLYVYPVADPGDPTRMDDYSIARQLALLFRDSVPDAELLDLAEAGALRDPATREIQVDRLIAEMVEDPSRRRALHRFFDEWWSMNVVEHAGKDPETYPEFTETLRAAMKEEIDRWIGDIVFESRRDFRSVLDGDATFVNEELAALYGIEGVVGDEFQAAPFPEDGHRTGLLTTAAFATVMSHPSLTSPAARGKFVTERLLCLEIPPPPGSVDTSIPPSTKPETKRERFVRHTTDPTCAGCHTLMDPSGLALENFDAIGRFRATERVVFDGVEHELPIDPSGELLGESFADGRDMAALLANSDSFANCTTRQLLRQTYGRELDVDEFEVVDQLTAEFVAGGYDYLELMRAVALHPSFIAFVPQE